MDEQCDLLFLTERMKNNKCSRPCIRPWTNIKESS